MNSISEMQEKIRNIVTSVKDSSIEVFTASSEISQGNNDLSVRTEQTASSLQEASANTNELSSDIEHSKNKVQDANIMSKKSLEIAENGIKIIKEVIATMEKINISSKQITDITSVIDSIAFQTNILALNAAVEAARAGEQGRGFAVVATEIRTLASRSAEAAKEIKKLITESYEKTEKGTQLVQVSGENVQEIVNSIGSVSMLLEEINKKSIEQSQNVNFVNEAIRGLESSTQQNAALVEESAAAASSMKKQAEKLTVLLKDFNL